MMTVLRLLLVLCAVPPPSNSIKCFTCIGSFIFHKRHTCLSTLGEREKECPPDVNYCELRLRIRNQNKYYHNRGRADGLSGWPQNYEVNFRGCGTPYQTQGDAYNNNQEFQEIAGNTKGLKCKEGVLDGQIRLRCLCPYDDCNDHPGETMGENTGLSNFSIIWICTAVLIALFLITCFICSVHQINNTR